MTARYGAVRGSLGHCAVVTPQPLSELPHPAGRIPVLGDVTSVDRHKPTQHETELTRELGPIFQRLLLGERLIVVGGAKLANQTLDERSWGRALVGPLAKLREVAGAGLFTAKTKDPLWGQARRILTPGFSQTAMRTYHDAMASVAADLSAQWEKEPTVDVHQDMTAATLEVIGRAGFSQRMGLLGDTCQAVTGTEEFLEALGRALTWASESTNDLPIIGPIREMLSAPGRHRDVATARRYVETIIEDTQRAGDIDTTDLLGLMLSTPDPETGASLPLDNVRDQVSYPLPRNGTRRYGATTPTPSEPTGSSASGSPPARTSTSRHGEPARARVSAANSRCTRRRCSSLRSSRGSGCTWRTPPRNCPCVNGPRCDPSRSPSSRRGGGDGKYAV